AAHWFSYIGDVIRGVPLYYPSWLKVPNEWKAALITNIGMSADVSRSHDGDSGGEDRPLHTMYPTVVWVALLTEAKANESTIWAAGQRGG
nr:hypothetical protein [Tanacetum cinerariifolium]